MDAINELRKTFPDYARDLKINLQNVFKQSSLSTDQQWGTALACAIAVGDATLLEAIHQDAAANCGAELIEDAKAAAALMGMNNVFYRFRHFMGKESYEKLPARLRMQRLIKPATNRTDFELFSMAVSSINGCEACLQAHEKVVLDGGLSEQNVLDAIRIASTLAGVGSLLCAMKLG